MEDNFLESDNVFMTHLSQGVDFSKAGDVEIILNNTTLLQCDNLACILVFCFVDGTVCSLPYPQRWTNWGYRRGIKGKLMRNLSSPGSENSLKKLSFLPPILVSLKSFEGVVFFFDYYIVCFEKNPKFRMLEGLRNWWGSSPKNPSQSGTSSLQALPTNGKNLAITNPLNELQILEGHNNFVTHLIQVDAHTIASSDDSGLIIIWARATGEALQSLEGHSLQVNFMLMLSGKRLVSGSSDKTVRVIFCKKISKHRKQNCFQDSTLSSSGLGPFWSTSHMHSIDQALAKHKMHNSNRKHSFLFGREWQISQYLDERWNIWETNRETRRRKFVFHDCYQRE